MNGIPTVTVPMESLAEVIELQLQRGGRANLTVTGSSMMPLFRNRQDSVILRRVEGRQEKGEIILYRRDNGQYVLHRIIGLSPHGYVCCGDNQYERENVRQDQLIGVVESFVRKGKSYALSHPGYRFYKAVWVGLFPLRRGYITLRRPLGRMRTRLRRRWRLAEKSKEEKHG